MTYLFRALLLCLPLAPIAVECQATRYFVNASATGSATGLTWTDAFTNLQEALGIVIPGDEIWVAAGQYKPTTSTNRAVSFALRNGVNVFGGFAGTETALDERDPVAFPSTLNGDIGEIGLASDNSHSVVTANDISTTIILDGFRILNGNNTNGTQGGGMRVTNALGGEVRVRNCRFIGHQSNNYGGGIYLAAANLLVEGCEFLNNESSNGGAIHNGNNNGGNSNLLLRDCVFKGNMANSGACLNNTSPYNEIVVDRCIFTNNSTTNSVIVIDDFLSGKLMNSAIIGNRVSGFSSEVLRVNTFGNSTSPFDLINCTIAHNRNTSSSPIQAEIIQLEDNHMVVSNCILFGNTSYAGRQMRNGPIVRHTLVEGGYPNGTNIIDTDPLFTAPDPDAPANFDATLFDYSLSGTSPAVNSGNNAYVPAESDLDLALVPRIQAGTVDMGCYESDFTTGLSTTVGVPSSWSYEPSQRALILANTTSIDARSVYIHDAHGRLVSTTTVKGSVVRVDLPAGVYFATAQGYSVLKFVVP
jgi:hypothetical protein